MHLNVSFSACTQEGADDPLLLVCTAQVMVKDGEQCYRMDSNILESVSRRKRAIRIQRCQFTVPSRLRHAHVGFCTVPVFKFCRLSADDGCPSVILDILRMGERKEGRRELNALGL